jgi:hypothetical protein
LTGDTAFAFVAQLILDGTAAAPNADTVNASLIGNDERTSLLT